MMKGPCSDDEGPYLCNRALSMYLLPDAGAEFDLEKRGALFSIYDKCGSNAQDT